MLKVDVAAVDGVPVIAPVVLRESPAGSEPELSVNWYGVVPFEAETVAVYATPTVPEGSEAVRMETGVPGAIVTL